MFGLEVLVGGPQYLASMKGPSRRRGNTALEEAYNITAISLNEGPLQKEGQ
ncbi:Hypothetical protein PFR_JS17-2_1960 [Propionibacterium freudenreichii]|nr:Hypothetical protein PFR_JS17-1_1961 [Propionibacterium freudenreichii]SCQ81043.1 Hypothetical protein PFR_JS17-2_1960 [Propionibacterium freudenreichii]